ncbi:pentapeptide repeat-containing protein [Tautonia marina]|uniref:pentapeptide repeat-containing protein n=1 Tax=Tautonia marina TaxID=2653855 RepID=UPI0012612F5C|nr:pentapeptide repeat-containing protein [Tautonia marina]
MDTTEPIERDETPRPSESEPNACDRVSDAEAQRNGSRKELRADEAEQKIRDGVPINHAVIVGRLRLRGTFEKAVRLQNVEIPNLIIDGAVFAEEVVFRSCRLNRPIIQRKTRFDGGLSMQGSELLRAKFDDVKIQGKANFQSVRFRSKLDILRVRFFEAVNFWEARFDGWVDFKMCRFDGLADFRSICADEGFSIRTCHFAGDFLVRGASVAKKFEFNDSVFEGMIDFSKAKLNDYVYLESITLGDGARFAFWNAVAERVQIRPEQLEGRIASECENDHAKAMCEYGLLKRNYEALHRHEEEDWAFYHFKVNERRSKPRAWTRPWSKLSQAFEWLVLDLGCRYGTSPFRTVAAAAVMIVAFSLVYMMGVTLLPLEAGKIPFDGEPTTLANRVVIGLVTSVSAFTDGLGSLRETAKGWMNLFLVAESLLGTLVWGLFIVAFSRKVIR